ncbi:ABC transporter substrate-binding protein [Streptomyces griseiscabiei]|uniref:Extracellular solute-binding protein n=1 Tax=Streptomyces griseiscabiei TaxID=2993540 RepID=A0ABU4L6A0_9ACTN|nr:extracellular solute-binding protein [Streptomyces griseiscabiei]MBZ3906208.1 extracellular solute-binding protein [Streptomyces griseiscabiei]MDX2911203.1 extracellular solute-binding protein [Streptomyces griseiscabiei]
MPMARRQVLVGGSVASAALALAGASGFATAPRTSDRHPRTREETRSLERLYREAKAEGGTLIVYAGGDTATQQDGNKAAFEKAFPGITMNIVVDYSKFHDARIDNQLTTGTLVPDVVQLQTLQDFPRWKKEGVLLPYKPAGFSRVHPAFKDPEGAWTGIFVDAFSTIYNIEKVGAGPAPATARDLLDRRLKGKIVSTFPNDDDAVLYLYKVIIDKYGWDWLRRFVAQDVAWVRGTQEPADRVEAGTAAVALGTDGMLTPADGMKTRFVLPERDPFMAWAQRAAIFRDAGHPAAAKLYLNWWLSKRTQTDFSMWSVRTDVTPHTGYRPIWDYPNAHLDGFERFMTDRGLVERFKQQLTLYVGEVSGAPSPGRLGLHPGR